MTTLDPLQQAAVVERYSRDVDALVKQSVQRHTAAMRNMRVRFRMFRDDLLRVLPESFPLNQSAIQGVLRDVAGQIDDLFSEVGQQFGAGFTETGRLNKSIERLYADRFLGGLEDLTDVGIDAGTFNIASQWSADLINLRTGGLGATIMQSVNRTLRLAAIGGAGNMMTGTALVNKALGSSKRWSYRAERIYRTEVLRVQSLGMQQTVTRLNKRIRTRKRWVWSGISRDEHKEANGQVVAASKAFKVRLREGGIASLRFPRDPKAPPSATINCGCYMVPVPQGAPRRPAAPAQPVARASAPLSPVDAFRQTQSGFAARLAADGGLRSLLARARSVAKDFGKVGSTQYVRKFADLYAKQAHGRMIELMADELGKKFKWLTGDSAATVLSKFDESFIHSWSGSSKSLSSSTLRYASRNAWKEDFPDGFYWGDSGGYIKKGTDAWKKKLSESATLVRSRLLTHRAGEDLRRAMHNVGTDELHSFVEEYVKLRSGFAKHYLTETGASRLPIHRGHDFHGSVDDWLAPFRHSDEMYVPSAQSSWSIDTQNADKFRLKQSNARFSLQQDTDSVFATYHENSIDRFSFGDRESEYITSGLRPMKHNPKDAVVQIGVDSVDLSLHELHAAAGRSTDDLAAFLDGFKDKHPEAFEGYTMLRKSGVRVELSSYSQKTLAVLP